MISPDQMALAMSAARDQILAAMRDHENETHQGRPCYGNRASAIGYLAHCLGVQGEVWDYALECRARYDLDCKGEECPHPEE